MKSKKINLKRFLYASFERHFCWQNKNTNLNHTYSRHTAGRLGHGEEQTQENKQLRPTRFELATTRAPDENRAPTDRISKVGARDRFDFVLIRSDS